MQVVSVGVDANLCISGPSKSIVKIPPLPAGDNVVVANDARLVALRKQTSIEVWKLGKGNF